MNLNATIFGQTISFVIFVLFCMKYVWPQLMAAIEKRQKDVADSLSLAERAKKDLEFARAEAANSLNQAKLKAQAIIEQANKRKVQIINEAQIEAEEVRNKILVQTQVEIDAEFKCAREELRKQIAMLVLAGVEKIIEHSINEATNDDIINKIIDKL